MKHPRPSQILVLAAIVTTILAGSILTTRTRSGAAVLASSQRSPTARQMLLAEEKLAASPALAAAPPVSGLDAMPAARELVRTATLSIEVRRYAEAAERAAGIAVEQGGYLGDASASREPGNRERGTLTLRVPSERFEAAVRALKALGRVDSLHVEAQDITREFTDLESRLAVKRAAAARMRELLQTKTARLGDVVEAEKEVSRLMEEIERLEGERRFDDRQVAFSTISVELQEPAAFVRDTALAPLRRALQEALPLFAGSLAALLYALAVGLPWALLALSAWKLRQRATARHLVAVKADR